MDGTVTEKNYPIRNIWLFKQISIAIIILPIYFIFIFSAGGLFFSGGALLVFLPFIFIFGLAFGILLIINILRRSNFHYSLEDHFIALHQ